MTEVQIRRATTADLPGVVRVGREAWPPTYTPIAGEEYVRDGLARWWTTDAFEEAVTVGQVWVAADGDDVLAMIHHGDVVDGAVTVWMLYVLPDQQGKGLGGRLMDAVIAANPDAQRIRLSHVDGNERAHGFYLSRGLVETERRASVLGGPDDVWLERTL